MLDLRKTALIGFWAAFAALFGQGGAGSNGSAASNARAEAYFRANVKPVFESYCNQCHGPSKQKAGLRFDEGKSAFTGVTPAVTPNDPERSLILSVIGWEGRVKMPPKRRLDDEQIGAIRKWIEDGAWWPAQAP